MPLSRNKELDFRQSHAFVIGINQYPGIDSPLKTPVRDSIEIAKRLKVLQGFDNVMLLNNVTLAELQQLLNWLKNPKREKKQLIESDTYTYHQLALTENLEDEEESSEEVEAIILPKISFLKLEKELTAEERKLESELPQLELEYQLGKTKGLRETLYLTPASEIDIRPQPEKADSEHKGDSLLFYFAGHGYPGKTDEGPSGFLAPSDTQNQRLNNESLLPMNEVYQALSAANCKHTMLILDCCFAGSFRFSTLTRKGSMPMFVPVHERRFKRYKERNAWQVLASSGPDQEANDSSGMKAVRDHSPFAITLIKALEGRADVPLGNRGKFQGDGIITATELFLYVWEKVEEMTHAKKPQHPGLFPMAQHRDGEFIFVNPMVDSSRFLFAEDPNKNPYQGLKPYTKADHELLFGRDRAINEVLERLTKVNVLFVTGGSGSGKSSLIKAGVIPRLERRTSHRMEGAIVLRPTELVNPQRKDWQWKSGDPDPKPFGDKLDELIVLLSSEKKHLFVIDQYEEMFMHAEKDQIQTSILYLFEKLLIAQSHQLIFTLRSDFEWQLKQSPLSKYWEKSRIYRIPPMEPGELREALTGPAYWAMYDFKDHAEARDNDNGEQLINEILDEITNAPGALPLLSFTMQSFYEISKELDRGQKLIKADYENELKGVEGALASRASKVFDALSDAEKKLMEKLMIRMVNIYDGSFTRRRVFYRHDMAVEQETRLELVEQKQKTDTETESPAETELIQNAELTQVGSVFFQELDFPGDDTELTALIAKLEFNHLVIKGVDKDGNAFVEPAHDALITHWDQCRKWIEGISKETLTLQRQLWQAVLDFEKESGIALIPAEGGGKYGRTDISDTASAYLWDGNFRLKAIFESILDNLAHKHQKLVSPDNQSLTHKPSVSNQKNIKRFWKDDLAREELHAFLTSVETFIGLSIPERKKIKAEWAIAFILSSPESWLNAKELEFVMQSWKQKVAWSKELKREREEARAIALTATARSKITTSPTLAYNLAYNAYQMYPSEKTASALYDMYFGRNIFFQRYKHSHDITSVALSPNGKYLVLGSRTDQKVRVWSVNTMTEIKQLIGHTKGVDAVAFSPNSRYIASGSRDKTVRIWSVKTGKEIKKFVGHTGVVESVAFSPDSNYIVSGSHDKTLRIWSRKTEDHKQFEGHESYVLSVGFSPDGKQIVSGSKDQTVRVWTVETGQHEQLYKHGKEVNSVAFSPNGEQIVSGSSDWKIRIWSKKTKEYKELAGHGSQVLSVGFSPDGKQIVSGGRDRLIRTWLVDTGELIETLKAHFGFVCSVTFSPDGKQIISGANDQEVLTWSLERETPTELYKHGSDVNSVSFSSDGQQIVSGSSDKTVIMYSLEKGKKRKLLSEQTAEIFSTTFSPDGKQVILGSLDKQILLLQVANDSTIKPLNGHTALITSVAFSPDGKSVVSGSLDKTVRIWSVETGQEMQKLALDNEVYSVAYAPDGKSIAIGSSGTPMRIWSFENEQVEELHGHDDAIYSVCFSPDGQQIVSGSKDKIIRIWDLETQQEVCKLAGHTDTVFSVSFAPDGRHIASGSWDKTMGIWSLETNERVRSVDKHQNIVHSVSFSPNGQEIVSGSRDRSVRLELNLLSGFPANICQLSAEELEWTLKEVF